MYKVKDRSKLVVRLLNDFYNLTEINQKPNNINYNYFETKLK